MRDEMRDVRLHVMEIVKTLLLRVHEKGLASMIKTARQTTSFGERI